MDLVLAEAHKRAALPKIEVFRTGVHPRPLYDGQAEFLAIAADGPLTQQNEDRRHKC